MKIVFFFKFFFILLNDLIIIMMSSTFICDEILEIPLDDIESEINQKNPIENLYSNASSESFARALRRMDDQGQLFDVFCLNRYGSPQPTNARRYSRSRYRNFMNGSNRNIPYVDRILYGSPTMPPFIIMWNLRNRFVIGSLQTIRPRGSSRSRLQVVFYNSDNELISREDAEIAWEQVIRPFNPDRCVVLNNIDAIHYVNRTIVESSFGAIWEYRNQ